MAGLGFRRWAQVLSRRKSPGISALLSGCRTYQSVPDDILLGPYPKTPEERAAAAKKYNLLVEDYEPYPDDGMGYGDYPKLAPKSEHERDPYYQWDFPEYRRNWGEPLHWDFDMYTRSRVDTSATIIEWSKMCLQLFGFIAFNLFMFYLGELYPSYPPIAPKQYPYNNLYVEKGGDPEKKPQEEVKHYLI